MNLLDLMDVLLNEILSKCLHLVINETRTADMEKNDRRKIIILMGEE